MDRASLPRSLPRTAAAALLTVWIGSAAQAQDIKRAPPVPAAVTVPDLSAIGLPHGLVVRNDTLYVGASEGLAAIDATGKLLWTLKLPAASVRHVDADAEHVAHSSADVAGLTAGSGATAALMWGDPSRKVEVSRADVGLATVKGEPVWSLKVDEPSVLSKPALGKTTLVVVGDKTARLLERKDGKLVADVSMFTNWLGISGNHATRVAVTPALWVDDTFFAAHQNWFKKVDAKGEELVATKRVRSSDNAGLTAGPVRCKDLLVIGEAAYPIGNIFTGKKARVNAVNLKGEPVWSATMDDEVGGVGSVACNDQMVVAAVNALVVAFDYSGKLLWEASNNRAGRLFPGTHRGVVRVRDVFGNAGPSVARSVVAGQQMLLEGPFLYITTRAKPDLSNTEDLVTVIEAKTGNFVEALEFGVPIIDMVVFGPQLAVSTAQGLKLVALSKPAAP